MSSWPAKVCVAEIIKYSAAICLTANVADVRSEQAMGKFVNGDWTKIFVFTFLMYIQINVNWLLMGLIIDGRYLLV